MNRNQNCCGSHCLHEQGDVRVYPLGSGGNLILCHACWAHENRYRYERGRETGSPEKWPQHDWTKAESYPPESAIEARPT